MKKFMDKDFLLSTETAKKLYAACENTPIFDWHCHLSPKEIYENKGGAILLILGYDGHGREGKRLTVHLKIELELFTFSLACGKYDIGRGDLHGHMLGFLWHLSELSLLEQFFDLLLLFLKVLI